jgi:Mce-associated membrane protein
VIDADRVSDPPQAPEHVADAEEALALAEEAEAEAAEAEAMAAAARARARAIRLRRQAGAVGTEVTEPPATAEPETTEAEEVEHVDTEDADEKAAENRSRTRRQRVGRILAIVAGGIAGLCTVLLIVASVLMVIHDRHQQAEQQRSAEFAAAARQSVVTLMSLDFNKAKEDVQRIIDNSTGQFKDDFKNQADDFVKVAQDSKVVTDVTVNATAVEKMTDNTATVLVSATSRVTNSSGAKQEPRSWRLSVDLQRDGGQIKMAKVEFVP